MTGAEIRANRKALRLTRKKLARALGVSHHTVEKWEWGYRVPNPINRARLCALASGNAALRNA